LLDENCAKAYVPPEAIALPVVSAIAALVRLSSSCRPP
jgi:hypothetical protein